MEEPGGGGQPARAALASVGVPRTGRGAAGLGHTAVDTVLRVSEARPEAQVGAYAWVLSSVGPSYCQPSTYGLSPAALPVSSDSKSCGVEGRE